MSKGYVPPTYEAVVVENLFDDEIRGKIEKLIKNQLRISKCELEFKGNIKKSNPKLYTLIKKGVEPSLMLIPDYGERKIYVLSLWRPSISELLLLDLNLNAFRIKGYQPGKKEPSYIS